MALVFSSDFKKLPADPIRRWLELRDLAEKRLAELSDQREGATTSDLNEYCAILRSAAEELGVGKLPDVATRNVHDNIEEFRAEVISLATRLSLRSAGSDHALSVALPRASRAKIFAQVERLRSLIDGSDLGETQKKRLHTKLDELQSLAVEPRVDFGSFFAVLAIIAGSVVGTTAFLADAPDAVATIAAIVGEAKEEEEEVEAQHLLQSQKEPLKLQDLRNSAEHDGEIPF